MAWAFLREKADAAAPRPHQALRLLVPANHDRGLLPYHPRGGRPPPSWIILGIRSLLRSRTRDPDGHSPGAVLIQRAVATGLADLLQLVVVVIRECLLARCLPQREHGRLAVRASVSSDRRAQAL